MFKKIKHWDITIIIHKKLMALVSNVSDVLMSEILSSQSKEIQQLKEQNEFLLEQNKKKG